MTPRRLCIWLPTWPVQRRVAELPALEEQAFAVVAQESRGGRIVACTSSARRLGATVGMPWTEAESFSGGRVRSEADDPLADRETLGAFADDCMELSPIVGVEEGERPECVFIDATGCAAAFGGEERLLDRAVEVAKRRRYAPRVALADTLGMAWAAAHFDARPRVLVPAGGTMGALAPMPLGALRIAAEAIAALQRLGVYTVGRLAELPRHLLPERFGPTLLDRLDQALGRTPELWTLRQFLPPIRLAQEFETALEQQDVVDACTARLVETLVEELPAETGVRRLELRLERPDRFALVEEVEFSRPMRSAKRLWEVLRLRMERLRDVGQVSAIRVEASAVTETPVVQDSLFDDPSVRMRKQEMSDLLDRLVGRLGRQGVLRCSASAHPEPPKQSVFTPAVPEKPATVKPSPRALWIGRRRPLKLFPSPIPVQVAESPSGPLRITLYGKDFRVQQRWGPERIDSGWQRDDPLARDYYRLETHDGAHWWAFRDLSGGGWYLHGAFE
jgi:protein ImuB